MVGEQVIRALKKDPYKLSKRQYIIVEK